VIYSVVLRDDNGDPVGVLENCAPPTYSRSKNTADQVTFSVPKGDPKIPLVSLGQRFEIVRNLGGGASSLEVSGFVSSLGWDTENFLVDGFTEEIVLERFFFPEQYSYPLQSENPTLDVFCPQLIKSFIIDRVKGNWASYISASSNIDFTTNPEFMLLTKSGGNYVSSGFVVFRFTKLANEEWERFRWVSDYYVDEDGEVTTKVSYRQADTIGALSSVAFTTPQAGALPDVVGIVIADPNLAYLEVRVDFATDTTEASPVLFSMEVIKRGLSEIHTVNVLGDGHLVDVPGLSVDNESFLSGLISALEPSGWEFEVVDGVLTVAETLGTNKSYDVVAVVE
jgi:hypothetical protein